MTYEIKLLKKLIIQKNIKYSYKYVNLKRLIKQEFFICNLMMKLLITYKTYSCTINQKYSKQKRHYDPLITLLMLYPDIYITKLRIYNVFILR